MEYVSEEQSDLIESILSGRRNTPVDYVIHRLYRFLDEKGENETLDPRWIDVWARLKKPASRSMPPKIIDTIEKQSQRLVLLMKVSGTYGWRKTSIQPFCLVLVHQRQRLPPFLQLVHCYLNYGGEPRKSAERISTVLLHGVIREALEI